MAMRKTEFRPPGGADESFPVRRLFLHEPGWRVGTKVGSDKVFCYVMSPGQDYYHRILDGEVYLFNDDERVCFACAQRRGLLSDQPRGLHESRAPFDLAIHPDDRGGEFDLVPPSESGGEERGLRS
jgi:hypothetical protein